MINLHDSRTRVCIFQALLPLAIIPRSCFCPYSTLLLFASFITLAKKIKIKNGHFVSVLFALKTQMCR